MRALGSLTGLWCRRSKQLQRNSLQASTPLKSQRRQISHQVFGKSHIPTILAERAPTLDRGAYRAVAEVFPTRTNDYVLDELIDWRNVPNDPIFRLVFPQPQMLMQDELNSLRDLLDNKSASRVEVRHAAELIRSALNPHPAGQKEENVPILDNVPMDGMQHKYPETVLFFPAEGQYCHAYCGYCFRWAQFTSVGSDQQFRSNNGRKLKDYIDRHPKVRDVLFTGGDPMVMPTSTLQRYIVPLMEDLPNLDTIRIATKALCFWPARFISDPDSGDLLRLFASVVNAGKHLTIQAHFTHPVELQTTAAREAIRLIRMTGAQIRCQGPLIRHINDSAQVWKEMWILETKLGMIPYYMFCERDTGASRYFSVPLRKCYEIFSEAFADLPGTARTVRGPSMSAGPGKVGIIGVEHIAGEDVFVLKFYQARNPRWTKRTFFAKLDPYATWLDELVPAFGEEQFFFAEEYRAIAQRRNEGSSGQLTF